MSIRDKINNSPALGWTVAAALILLTAVLFYHFKEPALPGFQATVFYTDDDGQTYFKDSVYKFPPFDHDGKQAVRAIVFSSASGNFVGVVQRYKPQAKKQLDKAYDQVQDGSATIMLVKSLLASRAIRFDGMEEKMPGKDQHWVSCASSPHFQIHAPDGGSYALLEP